MDKLLTDYWKEMYENTRRVEQDNRAYLNLVRHLKELIK